MLGNLVLVATGAGFAASVFTLMRILLTWYRRKGSSQSTTPTHKIIAWAEENFLRQSQGLLWQSQERSERILDRTRDIPKRDHSIRGVLVDTDEFNLMRKLTDIAMARDKGTRISPNSKEENSMSLEEMLSNLS